MIIQSKMVTSSAIISESLKVWGVAMPPTRGMLSVVHTQPMIYSSASSLADRSRVWVGRSIDPDVETMMQRHYGPSVGASAVVVAARHSTGYAHDVPDTIGTDS